MNTERQSPPRKRNQECATQRDQALASGNENWFVYILECADRSLYTGIALDLNARIELHNAGKAAKYTRGRGPVKLVYQERLLSKGDALKREYAIKQLSTQAKRRLLQ